MAQAGLELVGVLPEGGENLQQGVLEVVNVDADLAHVLGPGEAADIHLPVQGEGRGGADEALDLRAREVLCAGGERGDGDRAVQVARLPHLLGVDVENLHPPGLVREADLHVHLQPPRPQQRLVDEVHAVGHADEEDVVERVHPVDLRQELVHDAVVDARAVPRGPAGLADGVYLVEDDDVQLRVLALRLVLPLGVREEVADVLLRLPHVLVQDLGPVDDLRLGRLEELGQLPRDEGLARARRPVEQHAADVLDAEVPHDVGREGARRERPPEDVAELPREAPDAELLEVEVRPEDAALLHLAAQHVQLPRRALLPVQLRHGAQQARRDLGRSGAGPKVHRHEAEDRQLQDLALEVHDERLGVRQDLLIELPPEDRLEVLLLDLYSWVLRRRLQEKVYLQLAGP
mmetsp:Transcript_33905/g.105794  ORF Transcript_33905/g.105794 Transcript_33905/m.105794 type:complete len:404 (+) Transcript_33905:857-2068(+)